MRRRLSRRPFVVSSEELGSRLSRVELPGKPKLFRRASAILQSDDDEDGLTPKTASLSRTHRLEKQMMMRCDSRR